MEGTLQSEGPWTLLAPTDAVLDDAGFNVRLFSCINKYAHGRGMKKPSPDPDPTNPSITHISHISHGS
jgi:hypothetical protein